MLYIQLLCREVVQEESCQVRSRQFQQSDMGNNSDWRTYGQGNFMTHAVPFRDPITSSRRQAIQASKAKAVPDCLSDLGLKLEL